MAWRALLIDSTTQAGKTWKCFELIADRLITGNDKTLLLFMTQSNNTSAVNQLIKRARSDARITASIPAANIVRSKEACEGCGGGGGGSGSDTQNTMVVDFWHIHHRRKMLQFLLDTRARWDRVCIVFDECDQGGTDGFRERLSFADEVDSHATHSGIDTKLIFITATLANLSKSALHISKELEGFREGGIVRAVLCDPVVDHHFAEPPTSYVGPSWFFETAGVWRMLPPETKKEKEGKENGERNEIVLSALAELPDSAKELCLIVTSTRVEDHAALGLQALASDTGFNVSVALNSSDRGYIVHYRTGDRTGIKEWELPLSKIESMAERGELSATCTQGGVCDTGIENKTDLTLAHILQSTLFMMTDAQSRIEANSTGEEYAKLLCLSHAMVAGMRRSKRRPLDYPTQPRVALIAGHIAGRGITIQNPFIDFTCTSFCLTGRSDSTQRGASNAQRFGRACGACFEAFTRPGRTPILLATEKIMQDALANEAAVLERAGDTGLSGLKSLVSKDSWDRIQCEACELIAARNPKVKQNNNKAVERPIAKCAVVPIVKSGTGKAGEGVMATAYTRYTHAGFKSAFGLQRSPRDMSAGEVAQALLEHAMEAHVSMAAVSIQTVSDLTNFFRNPTWCHKPYHVIVKDKAEDTVVVIIRNTSLIQTIPGMSPGTVILAHDCEGALQRYVCKGF